MNSYSAVGHRIPRVDGRSLVTGQAVYTSDLALPRMLHGCVLRSPHPHARVLNVDVSRAARLPGVKAVVTGKETAGKRYGLFPDEPALAMDKVRYAGEAVAAVAAVDVEVAQEALDLIRVEYELLPAAFDPVASMQPGAPLVHEETGSNVSFRPEYHVGDVERGFAASDHVREDTFTTSSQCHCTMETHCAVADFDADGRLTLWSSTQGPFYLACDLALTLEMPLGDIRVIKPRVGGGFGSKREMMACDFGAALLSRRAGRPVRIAYSREEQFWATRARHPMIIKVKTGVKKDGTLLAREGTIIADGGAYNGRGPMILRAAGAELAGPYRVPNVRFTGYHVYTNKPVSSSFRGFGLLQCRFAVESQMDMLAEDLGLDPAEIRLKNAVGPEEVTSIGWKITSCGLRECIEKAVEGSGWKESRAGLQSRGLGIACGDYVSASRLHAFADSSAAYVRLHDDGTVVLLTGASDIGQGSDTTMCQIVAEELGVPVHSVRIISADTELAPRDLGTYASRVTFIAGNAARLAAADARRQILEVVADRLEANPDDLETRDGTIFVKGSPDRSLSFREAAEYVMKDRGVHVQGRGDYATRVDQKSGVANIAPTYSFGAQVADVEVDTETGQVSVRRFVAAHDCGFAINPLSLEGQVEGSVACGMGHGVYEGRHLEEGWIFNPSLLDYRIPTALEAPRVETALIESMDPMGPFGAKGVSEGAQVPVVPAIVNALYKAVGVRITDMPITPQKVLDALEGRARDPIP